MTHRANEDPPIARLARTTLQDGEKCGLGFVGSEQEWQRLQCSTGIPRGLRLVSILSEPVSTPWLIWPETARKCTDLEEILSDPDVAAMVLGGPIAMRAERLRRVLQAGRPCLCLQPADLSAIVYHEVAMIASDSGTVLIPDLPGRLHPAWRKLLSLVQSESLGRLRFVLIERTGPSPTGRTLVAECYAAAADLLSSIIGDISEVTATGDVTAGRLVVQHRTCSGPTAEIRLMSAPSGPVIWKVIIEADPGRAEASFECGLTGHASLRWSGPGVTQEQAFAASEADHGMLAEFTRAIASQPHMIHWSDAIRAAELAEWTWHSLDRRRSVDVYHEKRNELASFKGRMTSFGCGLIWLTLFIVLIVAAGKGLGIPGMDWLAAGAALIWVLFLGLQTLRWVFPREQDSGFRVQGSEEITKIEDR